MFIGDVGCNEVDTYYPLKLDTPSVDHRFTEVELKLSEGCEGTGRLLLSLTIDTGRVEVSALDFVWVLEGLKSLSLFHSYKALLDRLESGSLLGSIDTHCFCLCISKH